MNVFSRIGRWLERRAQASRVAGQVAGLVRSGALTLGEGAVVAPEARLRIKPGGRIALGPRTRVEGRLTAGRGALIELGADCYVNAGTYIGAAERVTIGHRVMIAHGVTIFDSNNHPVSVAARRELAERGYPPELTSWRNSAMAPVSIGDTVWIGMHAMVLKGVTIGQGAVVAAGAVVVKDVPERTMAAGNPARTVKTIED
ncbi:MAG: DapH/DapD/GlmU-related protein [Desulfovibrionaceae bacterium]